MDQKFVTSDHRMCFVTLSVPVPRINLAPRKVYLYSEGDYESFSDEIRSTDWNTKFEKKTLNQKWDAFKDVYQGCVEKYVPHKLVKPNQRHKPPWTNFKSVKKAKIRRRTATVRAKTSDLYAYKMKAEQADHDVCEAVHRAKSDFENNLVNQIKTEPKKFFNYTRHFTRSSSTVDVLEKDGVKVSEDGAKADILNDFFCSVLTDEPPVTHSIPFDVHTTSPCYNIKITPDHVREKLATLKPNKACGTDGVRVNVLREVADFDVPLAALFQHSVTSGTMPQDWKDANVTPLHKKGSRTDCNNYRPVSLTSQVVKVLERLVLDVLLDFTERNQIISCEQHGFQKGCSCTTQLLECIADWTKGYEDKACSGTDAVYLDFSKVFDSVPHQRLIYKFQQLGIRGNLLQWIKAFLIGRRQRVILRNGASSWRDVISGVPQGTILGPMFFLLFVNDMPDVVSSTAKMFADDTKLHRNIYSANDCKDLQEDLNTLSAWSHHWLLRFNASKCVTVRFRSAFHYVYSLNGIYLEEASEQKDLGVLISNDLKLSRHICNVCKHANQRIGMIKRCFSHFTSEKISILYKAIIRPILEYASVVWNPIMKKDIDQLEKVQKRCLRLCPTEISLPTLAERRRQIDVVETFKFLNGKYKTASSTFFELPHREGLRGHSHKIFKKDAKTEVAKQFFGNRVVNEWNSLPQDVISAPSVSTFKDMLRALPPGTKSLPTK